MVFRCGDSCFWLRFRFGRDFQGLVTSSWSFRNKIGALLFWSRSVVWICSLLLWDDGFCLLNPVLILKKLPLFALESSCLVVF